MRVLAIAALSLSSEAASNYRPVVMMHGLNAKAADLDTRVQEVKAQYPGIYVVSLATYEGSSSMLTDIRTQLTAMTKAIQNDSNLANGFNFYGESQGALLARAYVTMFNDPPVHNLVAQNGPQNGVGECPTIEVPVIKQLCGDLGTDLQIYHWPFCSFCGYWRGKNKDTYLHNSQFIADVNNDRAVNETRRQNMISLNKYMATVALRDEIVQPKESAWHTYWRWGDESRSSVMRLNETDGYKNDVLGLQTLDRRGDLILNSFDGTHNSPSDDWWRQNVLPMFNNRLSSEGQAFVV